MCVLQKAGERLRRAWVGKKEKPFLLFFLSRNYCSNYDILRLLMSFSEIREG